MRLHVLSDLHLEFSDFRAVPVDADVVVLAGDIGNGRQGLRWALESFRGPVLYVLGNHEFYGEDLSLVETLRHEAAGSHVHVLEREAIEIGGTRFLGCTLWTDFGLFGPDRRDDMMRLAESAIRDFHVITVRGEPFTADRSRQEHRLSREWLQGELRRSNPRRPTVVVTHHAPHPGSLSKRFERDPVSCAFVSNLEELMGGAALWIHGHTHASFDYEVRGTRVLCNAKGYVPRHAPGRIENPAFDSKLVVTVAPVQPAAIAGDRLGADDCRGARGAA